MTDQARTIRITRRGSNAYGWVYVAFVKRPVPFHAWNWHLRKEEYIGVANTKGEIDLQIENYQLKNGQTISV